MTPADQARIEALEDRVVALERIAINVTTALNSARIVAESHGEALQIVAGVLERTTRIKAENVTPLPRASFWRRLCRA